MRIPIKVKVWDVFEKSFKFAESKCSNCRGDLLHVRIEKVNSFGTKKYAVQCSNCSVIYEILPQFQEQAANIDYYNAKSVKEKKVDKIKDSEGNEFDPEYNFLLAILAIPFGIGLVGVIAGSFGESTFNLVFWTFLLLLNIVFAEMPYHFVTREIAVIIGTFLNYYVFIFLFDFMGQPDNLVFVALSMYLILGSAVSYYTRPFGELKEIYKRDRQTFQTFYNGGLQEYRKGNLQDALNVISFALKFNDGHEEAFFKLGEIYIELNKYEGALKIIETSDYKLRFSPKIWYKIGNLAASTQKIAQAEVHFQRAVKLDPEYTEAWIDLFTIYFESKRYELAMDALNTILEYEPGNLRAENLLSKVKGVRDLNQESLIIN